MLKAAGAIVTTWDCYFNAFTYAIKHTGLILLLGFVLLALWGPRFFSVLGVRLGWLALGQRLVMNKKAAQLQQVATVIYVMMRRLRMMTNKLKKRDN